MTEPRQKSIGVTPKEKERLAKAKQLYEESTGDKADWGSFLGAVSVLGLAALGVYKLVKSSKRIRQPPVLSAAGNSQLHTQRTCRPLFT